MNEREIDSLRTRLTCVSVCCAAILFLHDPSSNELWTQREDAKVLQVPASLGIAGYTFSTCSSVLVDDIGSDQRFHALVDQFVVSSLRHETQMSSSSLGMTGPSTLAKPKIALFSSTLLSHEGKRCSIRIRGCLYHLGVLISSHLRSAGNRIRVRRAAGCDPRFAHGGVGGIVLCQSSPALRTTLLLLRCENRQPNHLD